MYYLVKVPKKGTPIFCGTRVHNAVHDYIEPMVFPTRGAAIEYLQLEGPNLVNEYTSFQLLEIVGDITIANQLMIKAHDPVFAAAPDPAGVVQP